MLRAQLGGLPCTTLWYVEGAEYFGRLAIRHRLTDFLRDSGGHIGYDVSADDAAPGMRPPCCVRRCPWRGHLASTRSDSSHRSQPAAALPAITAGRDRGIVDELASRHTSPEHLIDLRNHPIREPHHNTLRTRDVAITARTRAPLTETLQ